MVNRYIIYIIVLLYSSIVFAEPKTIDLFYKDRLQIQVPETLTFKGTHEKKSRDTTVLLKDNKGMCEIEVKITASSLSWLKEGLNEFLKEMLSKRIQRMSIDDFETKVNIQKATDGKFPIFYCEFIDRQEETNGGRYKFEGIVIKRDVLKYSINLTL